MLHDWLTVDLNEMLPAADLNIIIFETDYRCARMHAKKIQAHRNRSTIGGTVEFRRGAS